MHELTYEVRTWPPLYTLSWLDVLWAYFDCDDYVSKGPVKLDDVQFRFICASKVLQLYSHYYLLSSFVTQ